MTVDELTDLLRIRLPEGLTPLQELVLRYAWEGKTYATMAAETNYVKEYLSRTAAELWSVLSNFWEEEIGKNNLRLVLESRPLTKAQRLEIAKVRVYLSKPQPAPEFPDGPVAVHSPFYVDRPPLESLAYEEVAKPGSIIRLKAPWKMGKTSLMLRILDRAVSLNYRTVTIDFQQAEKSVFSSIDKFFRWFSRNVGWKLQLEPKLDEYWDEDMGSKVSCTIYFEAYLLQQISSPIVLALNEVNLIFAYPDIAEDFFSLLRSWYEQARSIKIWQNLRVIIAYSTEVYIPLHINQSPFNVGLPLKLPTFTPEQILTLAQLHHLDWTPSQAKQLIDMVGGHPYLTRLALYHICRGELTLKQLLQAAPTESGIYRDHLRNILAIIQGNPALVKAFMEVISAPHPVKLLASIAYQLDSMGLVNIDGDLMSPSCDLYRLYFKNQILENH